MSLKIQPDGHLPSGYKKNMISQKLFGPISAEF